MSKKDFPRKLSLSAVFVFECFSSRWRYADMQEQTKVKLTQCCLKSAEHSSTSAAAQGFHRVQKKESVGSKMSLYSVSF